MIAEVQAKVDTDLEKTSVQLNVQHSSIKTVVCYMKTVATVMKDAAMKVVDKYAKR